MRIGLIEGNIMELKEYLAHIIGNITEIKDIAGIRYPITIECNVPVAPKGTGSIDVRVVSGKDAENTPRIKLTLTV